MLEGEEDRTKTWDAIDIKMSIKRYFHKLKRDDVADANLEIEFLRAIHREWSYNPGMRRCDPPTMAIIDDFLKWFDSTAPALQKIDDFEIRRILKM